VENQVEVSALEIAHDHGESVDVVGRELASDAWARDGVLPSEGCYQYRIVR
jgi:hypothetical protein